VAIAYPVVNKGHILPRVWQRNFAIDGQTQVRVVDPPGSHLVTIDDSGTRRRPYRRTRPDGTPIDDVEWSLHHIEHAVAPILADVESRWPLSLDDKRTLAELFAVQMVRGPHFFEHRAALVERSAREGAAAALADIAVSERVIDHWASRMRDHFLSDTDRLRSMLRLSKLITAILASMHWTLLRFADPLIALSDQPVVIWPLDRASAAPSVTPAWGPETALEVRVPVSPRLAIVMTWIDRGDGPLRQGRLRQAQALNAFTIAQADRQWMHLPGAEPPVGPGPFEPLSPRLEGGYNARVAQRSTRRAQVARHTQARRGEAAGARDIEIVWLPPTATRRP
jgi:hypothetical protein